MRPRRIAGAPITWGVCEVPGWGHQMSPSRVLAEMTAVGLTATEMGPPGYLPARPDDLRRLLDGHGLELVAGFVPVVLHDHSRWPEERSAVARQMQTLASVGASVVVVAAETGDSSYESTASVADREWSHLVRALDELEGMASELGLALGLHPHYGTVVVGPGDIERLLATSSVRICLDTGHLLVGGGDPVAVTVKAAHRVAHVHLKDVDAALTARLRRGELSYRDAVARGLYRPLGHGEVDIPAILAVLDEAGYEGWFVLEQDTVLSEEPEEGKGPVVAAELSYRYLTERVPAR